jgi:hypothetical protein
VRPAEVDLALTRHTSRRADPSLGPRAFFGAASLAGASDREGDLVLFGEGGVGGRGVLAAGSEWKTTPCSRSLAATALARAPAI